MPRLIRRENGDVVGMNVPALKLLRDAVQIVQSAQIRYPAQGVCSNVDYYTIDSGVCGYESMQFLAVGWEHARLDPNGYVRAYFVPHDPSYSLWAGPNWRMRHDFMEYALRRIETMLKAQEGTDA